MVVIPVIGLGAFIEPFLYLSVAVRKIESARSVMVTGGKIDDLPASRRERIESVHLRNKIAVVNAVIPFIEEDKCLSGSWRDHVAEFFYDCIACGPRCDSPRPGIIIAKPIVHRHRADVGIARGSDGAPASIGRAAPHPEGLVVRP